MDPNQFKIHVEGMLAGLQGLCDGAISSVKKSYADRPKEELEQFEAALKSSNVEAIVKKNIQSIKDLNRDFKHE